MAISWCLTRGQNRVPVVQSAVHGGDDRRNGGYVARLRGEQAVRPHALPERGKFGYPERTVAALDAGQLLQGVCAASGAR